MLQKHLIMLGLVLVFGIRTPVCHANDQVAADLFSNSVRGGIPEIKPASASAADTATEKDPAEDSLNFLSEQTLEPSAPQQPAKKTAIHFLTGIDVDQMTAPADYAKQLAGVDIPVSVLVFEKCTTTGDAANGSSECEWRYSSGFKSTLISNHTHDGKRSVSHFIMTENDRGGTWQGRRDVLHITLLEDGKIAFESYDITYDLGLSPGETAHESAKTREVLRYNYDTTSPEKKLKDMSWTKYADTREGTPREMEYHAVLTYDAQGRPQRGIASKWSSGWKANTLFDWTSQKDAPDISSREMWQMWEQWIKNGPSHVFIV